MNQAPFFNAQFVDDDGTPLAGGLLYTYLSGTTTPQATYEDQAGDTPNTNPIVLDAAGRCNLWLDPAVEYTLLLQRANATEVKTWDDVTGAALTTGIVTSVNGEAGAVVFTAADIPFTTGTSTSWFVGTDVSAALDAIITRTDSSMPAAAITIADAGGLYTATTVESALAEVRTVANGIPSQTGNSGKYLTTNGTAASWDNPIPSQAGNGGKFLSTDGSATSWQVAGAGTSTQSAIGTITFPGGLIMKWGTTGTFAIDSAGNAVSFAAAFPNACFIVMCQAATDNGVSALNEFYSLGVFDVTAAGFKVNNDSEATVVSWFAIGN